MTASNLKLTQKQEDFCLAYLETGNASEAYRRAYRPAKMTDKSVNEKASQMLAMVKIRSRLEELRAPIIAKARLTVDDLLAELEEARVMAMEEKTPAPAVSATMGKAKLLGYDKQILEHHGPNGAPLIPSMIVLCAPGDDASQD